MMKLYQKINLQETQRNRNATANFVNLKRTSTVVPDMPHKPQGDSKAEVLSLHDGLLPKMAEL